MVRPALAASRAAAFLNHFAAHPGVEFTLSELCAALGVNLASALSVLRSLEDAGHLVRHPRRKTYALGPALIALGDAALRGNRAVDLVCGHMRGLAAEWGTELVVSTAVGEEIVLLAVEGSPQIASSDVRVGQRLRMVPPLGQVFVAWAAPHKVAEWLDRLDVGLRGTAGVHLPVALAAVRERGWSVTVDSPTRTRIGMTLERLAERPVEAPVLRERLAALAAGLGEEDYELLVIEPGRRYDISTIVAPVFDAHGDVSVALTVNGLTGADGARITAYGEHLASVTRRVTRETGGVPPG